MLCFFFHTLQEDFTLDTDPVTIISSNGTAVQTEDDDHTKEEACSTLFLCILTTLNQGLRNGGGIGDVLRLLSHREDKYFARIAYDMSFFFLLIVITLNLILGIIIDTFADLRKEKQEKDDKRRNTCFICGLERRVFDAKGISFERHCKSEHHIWSYLNFIVLIETKDPTEYNGPESYVYKMMKLKHPNLSWFPRLMAGSLKEETSDNEQQFIRSLHECLLQSTETTRHLSDQLKQLQHNLAQQRKEATRLDMKERSVHEGHNMSLINIVIPPSPLSPVMPR